MSIEKKTEFVLLDDDQYADANHPSYHEESSSDQGGQSGASKKQRIVLIAIMICMALGMVAQMVAGR